MARMSLLPSTASRSSAIRLAIVLSLVQTLWLAAAVQFIGPRYNELLLSDIGYFYGAVGHMVDGQRPYRDFEFDYPPGALVPILAPLAAPAAATDPTWYIWGLVIENALAAAAITLVLAGFVDLRSAIVFNVLLALTAPYAPLRFDLLPALVTLLAVLWAQRRAATAGGMIALGTVVKLFPIVLLPVLLLPHVAARRWRSVTGMTLGFAITLVAILAPAWVLSRGHVFDFFAFHQARGLQIESLGGGLLLIAGQLHWVPVTQEVSFFSSNLVSPWASPIIRSLQPMMLIAFAIQAIVLWRRWRVAPPTLRELGSAVAVTLGLFICFNRVFSPQYLIWLLPLFALADQRLAMVTLVCVLTTLLFPFQYTALQNLQLSQIVQLNIRNVLFVGLIVYGLTTRPRNKIAPV